MSRVTVERGRCRQSGLASESRTMGSNGKDATEAQRSQRTDLMFVPSRRSLSLPHLGPCAREILRPLRVADARLRMTYWRCLPLPFPQTGANLSSRWILG